MDAVRLTVSAPEPVSTEYTGFSARQLAAELSGLSRGNPELVASELRQLLTTLNASMLRKVPRIDALELMRPAVCDACEVLIGRYRGAALPLAEDDRRQAGQVGQLLSLLGDGYKRVVNERLEAARSGERPRVDGYLALGLQRAALAAGRSLMEHYRLYAPEPAALWSDLHRLFRNAETFRLQTQPFEAVGHRDETALSIKQAYLRAVVLSLANPHHLLQGEAEALYRRLGRWVHHVRMSVPDSWRALDGAFVVDLDSDFPPHYRPRSRRLPTPGAARLLDLSALVDAVDGQLEAVRQDDGGRRGAPSLSQRMQRNMYLRFREALSGRQERRDQRRSTVARISLVEGLSGCHFFLNGRRSFNPETEEARWNRRLHAVDPEPGLSLSKSEYLSDSAEPDGDPRQSRFRAHDAEADDVWQRAHRVNPAQEAARGPRRVQHRAVTWHRKNEGDGGMALFCVQPRGMRVRVGELTAYSDNPGNDPERWRLGQVRWLRTRPGGGLEIGVRHVAAGGHAVGTKGVQGVGRDTEYMRGIIVPRVNPLTEDAGLISPAGIYEPGSVLKVNMGELIFYVRLTERVSTTQLVAHFAFETVEPPAHLRGR